MTKLEDGAPPLFILLRTGHQTLCCKKSLCVWLIAAAEEINVMKSLFITKKPSKKKLSGSGINNAIVVKRTKNNDSVK